MPPAATFAVVAAVVFGLMLAESRRAAVNERGQLRRGGVEPPGDVYRVMKVAYPAAFLAMFVEGIVQAAMPRTFAAGAILFVASKALKYWAIWTLGPSWTFRVIVVPDTPLVHSGPYGLVRHPNYVAVAGELVSVGLLTGARFTGPIATLVFCGLMIRRIVVEERALRRSTPRAEGVGSRRQLGRSRPNRPQNRQI